MINMVLEKVILKVCAVLFIVCATFSVASTKVEAVTKSETETIQADLDGDGEKEKIKILYRWDEEDFYGVAKIYVNGRWMKTFNDSPMGYERKILNLANGKQLFYFQTCTFDGDGEFRVYKYDGQKLKCIVDFKKVYGCRWVKKIKVKGNSLYVNMEDSGAPGIGYMSFRSIYDFKSGKFRLRSKKHKILWYADWSDAQHGCKKGIFKLNTNKRFKIYSDRKCKHYIGKVPLGTVMKVTKTYRTGNRDSGYSTFYVTGMGYKGWYTSKDVGIDYLFEDVGGVA